MKTRPSLLPAVLVLLVVVACPLLSRNTDPVVGGSQPETGTTITSLDEIAWLAGRWEGEAFGGRCEETWSPASANCMVGMFRLIVDDIVSFYEIMTITVDTTGPVLSLKHFHCDLTGWEEKDEVLRFPLTEGSSDILKFDGLSYERRSDDSLRITVHIGSDDDAVNKVVIDCVRADD